MTGQNRTKLNTPEEALNAAIQAAAGVPAEHRMNEPRFGQYAVGTDVAGCFYFTLGFSYAKTDNPRQDPYDKTKSERRTQEIIAAWRKHFYPTEAEMAANARREEGE